MPYSKDLGDLFTELVSVHLSEGKRDNIIQICDTAYKI